MKSRRSVLALAASAGIASTAGCIEQIPFVGDEPLTFNAEAATVPQAALDETGYDSRGVEEIPIEETFEAAGRSQEVHVTNWQAEYDKALDLGDLGLPVEQSQQAAVFTALTTPQVSVLGRTFNPVAEMSPEELATMVQDQYEGLGSLEFVDEAPATIAGESTTVGELAGQATLEAEAVSIDLTLHISEAVESGDDLIVGVGGYPTDLRDIEEANIFTLLEAIEHDG